MSIDLAPLITLKHKASFYECSFAGVAFVMKIWISKILLPSTSLSLPILTVKGDHQVCCLPMLHQPPQLEEQLPRIGLVRLLAKLNNNGPANH